MRLNSDSKNKYHLTSCNRDIISPLDPGTQRLLDLPGLLPHPEQTKEKKTDKNQNNLNETK